MAAPTVEQCSGPAAYKKEVTRGRQGRDLEHQSRPFETGHMNTLGQKWEAGNQGSFSQWLKFFGHLGDEGIQL